MGRWNRRIKENSAGIALIELGAIPEKELPEGLSNL